VYGYAGTILRVDLSGGRVTKEETSAELARDWIGGRGFIIKTLWDEIKPGTAPFAPGNKVVVASGPLAGVLVPAGGKLALGTKSPATGGYGDTNMGGTLAAELKFAGYDAIIVEGAAKEPCVLVIDDDKVELRKGDKYWGLGSVATEKALKDDLGQDFSIMTIGPAGEKMVHFACVSQDFGRQGGRTGVGAVLGSKRLKAIAVRGSKSVKVADLPRLAQKAREMYRAIAASPAFTHFAEGGTPYVVSWVNDAGCMPTKNFTTGYFAEAANLNEDAVQREIKIGNKACYGCNIGCGNYSKAKALGEEIYLEGPEYESIGMLGSNCLLGNLHEVAYACLVADELGMDTISSGGVVAFALECFEKGIITKEDVGREVRFGDLESVVYLLRLIGSREGIGDVLARGVKHAASVFGKGSERFAIQIKGLEMSAYEPRMAPAMMLAYMTCDVGAHHNRSWAVTYDLKVGRDVIDGKAAVVAQQQAVRPLFDCLGLCRLPWVELSLGLDHYDEIFALVTGRKDTWDDLVKVSARMYHLTRSFNVREIPGYGRAFDYPPARFMEERVPSGPSEGAIAPKELLDTLLDDYYAVQGWDKNGVPTRGKLTEIGLGYVADALKLP
jgi:aldehyde:ferredoxin oxidoreductase